MTLRCRPQEGQARPPPGSAPHYGTCTRIVLYVSRMYLGGPEHLLLWR